MFSAVRGASMNGKSGLRRFLVLGSVFAIAAVSAASLPAFAEAESSQSGEIKMTVIEFSDSVPCTITNADGETLVYDGGALSGTMGHGEMGYRIGYDQVYVSVEDSTFFSYEPDSWVQSYFIASSDSGVSASWRGTNLARFEARRTSAGTEASVEPRPGKTASYHISLSPSDAVDYASIDGKSGSAFKVGCSGGAVFVSGDRGKATVEWVDASSNDRSRRCYLYGNARIAFRGGKARLSGASAISGRTSRRACGLRLTSADGGRGMFLTWNKVRRARSYRVYQRVDGRWRRVALRRGRGANYLFVSGASPSERYRYRVRAFAKKNGRRALGRASYPVCAVSRLHAHLANARSVTVSRGKVRGRAGSVKRVSATVAAANGETRRLVSGKVRWYSSNPKVCRVGKRGRVLLLRKGRARIWAKAHNGVNSKKIPVRVLAKSA
jgi:hypothetical protein